MRSYRFLGGPSGNGDVVAAPVAFEPIAAPVATADTCHMLVGVIGVALAVGALMALTSFGQRRRGHGLWAALLAGVFFPIAWAVWYLRDEHPRRAGSD